MKRNLQDICPSQAEPVSSVTGSSRQAIHVSTAYVCESPADALAVLDGEREGYAYQRDGHPNADALAQKCCALHGGDRDSSIRAVVTSSGMSATSLALLSQLKSGDHVVLSSRLYGLTATLVRSLSRMGITSSVENLLEPESLTLPPATRMLIVETISNPLLRVADLKRLSEIAHATDALLLVDNTFASPIVCRPFEHGADLVVESLTKIMNGHGDLSLGLLCGRAALWVEVPKTLSMFGLTSAPFDCWLADRGVSTLFLRMTTACQNAATIAARLEGVDGIERVDYPGLESHPDHRLARQVLRTDAQDELFGNMLTIHLRGGIQAAEAFIRASRQIHFVPSLGELTTTLSHPATTSHKGVAEAERQRLGISDGTIRISTGIESASFIEAAVRDALAGLDF